MRDVFLVAVDVLVTLAKALRPGDVRALAAESSLLKHQIPISNPSKQRAPNLTSLDPSILGLITLFINPHRIAKLAAILRRERANRWEAPSNRSMTNTGSAVRVRISTIVYAGPHPSGSLPPFCTLSVGPGSQRAG